MSGLGRSGTGVAEPLALGVERVWRPDMFQNPNRDWPVATTPLLVIDPKSNSRISRQFDPNTDTAIGFNLWVPEGAERAIFRIPYRAGEEPEEDGVVIPRLWARTGEDQEWRGPVSLGVIRVPPNDLFQTASFPMMLKTLFLEVGDYVQFLFARNAESRYDTLPENWNLMGLGVTFA